MPCYWVTAEISGHNKTDRNRQVSSTAAIPTTLASLFVIGGAYVFVANRGQSARYQTPSSTASGISASTSAPTAASVGLALLGPRGSWVSSLLRSLSLSGTEGGSEWGQNGGHTPDPEWMWTDVGVSCFAHSLDAGGSPQVRA